jgi:dephospho-CoA kinase
MYVIGLTGGVGSGKSTVADLFLEYGVPVIDADQIARELVEPGKPALQTIVHTFGKEILAADGSLNRRRLRDLIFSSIEQRKQLEAILHPMIMDTMMDRLDALHAPYAILVIPLLVDTGNWEIIDRILVVDTEEDLQIDRVTQRDNVSLEQAEAIIDNQVSRQERLSAADDIIENTGSVDDLKKQVKRLHEFYSNLAQQESSDLNPAHANSYYCPPGHLCYEQPLNERIRTFLRLEHLFKRATYHLNSGSEHDAHAFILTMIEINNLISRGDLKSEVMKELERQSQTLKKHSDRPSVDQEKLRILLAEQSKRMAELHQDKEPLGHHLKDDILFGNIRQRLSLPGGTCEFDLPIYNYWLNLHVAQRTAVMQAWLAPLQSIASSIALSLEIIRASSEPVTKIAINGYYEESLKTGAQAQLMRVSVEQSQPYYPTISAGKQRFSIRFLEYVPGEPRSPQVQQDITFDLMIGTL